MQLLAVLSVLYLCFGMTYYGYRRGLYGDGGYVTIALLLIAVIASYGRPYLLSHQGVLGPAGILAELR